MCLFSLANFYYRLLSYIFFLVCTPSSVPEDGFISILNGFYLYLQINFSFSQENIKIHLQNATCIKVNCWLKSPTSQKQYSLWRLRLSKMETVIFTAMRLLIFINNIYAPVNHSWAHQCY